MGRIVLNNVNAIYNHISIQYIKLDEPGAAISNDIQIDIVFPSLPQEIPMPEKLSFQGKDLLIKDGSAHITCREFYESIKSEFLKRKKGEIYVDFVSANGRPERVYGDLKPLA